MQHSLHQPNVPGSKDIPAVRSSCSSLGCSALWLQECPESNGKEYQKIVIYSWLRKQTLLREPTGSRSILIAGLQVRMRERSKFCHHPT